MNIPSATHNSINTKPLVVWLLFCAFMVFAMTIIGAITRLTESGLSITEWRPLIGAIPPLNEADWQKAFDLYKQTPEFIKKNFWMEMHDFKTIFFWEWFHRLWGRLIGLAFALPLAYFWIRGMIPQGYKSKFLILLALGGAQGFMGWYMVQSGLIDQPAVSHYRLAAHLSLALIIFCGLIWLALSLTKTSRAPQKPIFLHTLAVLAMVSITILWGAFTAGLDAGLIYNETFPKMGGQWIPAEVFSNVTITHNIIENPGAVQFIHRWLAMATGLAVFSLWVHARKSRARIGAIDGLMAMIMIQIGLGIATLLSGVHIHLAATHQAGAVILLGLLMLILYRTAPRAQQASKE